MKALSILPFFAIIAACASGNVNASVCKADSLDYTDPGAGFGGTQTITFTSTIDVSSELSKIDDYGTLHVYPQRDVLTGSDLSWMTSLKVDIIAQDGTDIEVLNTSVNVTTNTTINLKSSVDLYQYLHDGKIMVLYTVTGTLPPSFTANNQICLYITGETDKNINDIPSH